ncbi:hypothetical protein CYMTET_8953 [Cymbomonas tetramitiformis]|uniref:Uncharacterized protein n=1 Tax=Cymbomonas tetramitiformis TaxID=36881 RepID=A0AAE0GSM9_9CHLO|nr:hypothetical protein CYMTET_8953 [Cymbomonas tetramitiformis]|eukprot:gene14325-16940_t
MGLEELVGEWTLEAVENYDAFLAQQGVSWLIRTAASAMGFGVGGTTLKIAVEGDKISLSFKNPKCANVNEGTVGSESKGFAPDGQDLNFEYKIEGGLFIMIGKDPAGKAPDAIEEYSIVDGKLVKCLKSGDVVAKEIYKK